MTVRESSYLQPLAILRCLATYVKLKTKKSLQIISNILSQINITSKTAAKINQNLPGCITKKL